MTASATPLKRQDSARYPDGSTRPEVSERVTHIYLQHPNVLINSGKLCITVGRDLEVNGPGSFSVEAAFREAAGVRMFLSDETTAFIPNSVLLLALTLAESGPKPSAA